MDNSGQIENERHRVDIYGGVHTPVIWNMVPQYQMKEAANALLMNKKIVQMISEKDDAIQELNRAISDRNSALEKRNEAFKDLDEAITARDTAYRERDSAIAALQFHVNSLKGQSRGTKRKYQFNEAQIADAFALSIVPSEAFNKPQLEKIPKKDKPKRKFAQPEVLGEKSPRKEKKASRDLNRHVSSLGTKAEWEAKDLGLTNIVNFDESTMPAPVCTCTGVPHQCYKWSGGGWQSACCTTSVSVYPLPQLPNKRRSRMSGRKMSGGVFTRLLTHVAADGHDLSVPLDLKNYWAKHGTNRYITIK